MNNTSRRLLTYSNWPPRTHVWPQQLSNAGFFYGGEDTRVQCFSCGIVTSVNHWPKGARPEVVHYQLNSDCDYLRGAFPKITNKIESLENHDNLSSMKVNISDSQRNSINDSELLLNDKAAFTTTSTSKGGLGTLQIAQNSHNQNTDEHELSPFVLQRVNNFDASQEVNTDALSKSRLSVKETENSQKTKLSATNMFQGNSSVNNKMSLVQDLNREFTNEPAFSFPQHEHFQERLLTFKTWPVPAKQSPQALAESGLFYTGDNDVVRCFCCNLGLSEWAAHDDPWIEHAKHNPRCWFLRKHKDKEFIDSIQREWKTRYKPKNPAFDDLHSRLGTFDGWRDDIEQTREMMAEAGFFYTGEDDIVRCHYCDGGLRNWEPGDLPWEEHARWFPTCKYVIKIKGLSYIKRTKEKYEQIDRTANACSSNSSENSACQWTQSTPLPQERDPAKLRVINNELKNSLLCVVCKKKDRCMLFTNCGHRVTCEQCCHSLDVCPECYKGIKKVIKTFLS